MTYEDRGVRHAPCKVLIRTGPDGLHWGDPTSDGTVVTSIRGAQFSSAPTVAWSPDGGPDGTLLVIGRVLNGANGLAAPGNGATVLASSHGPAGPWHEVRAPVRTAAAWDATPINYSSPLLPLGDDLLLGLAADREGDRIAVRWGIVALAPLVEGPTSTTEIPVPPSSPPPAAPVPGRAGFTG